MVKGKLEIRDMTDRWGGEVWVEDLAPMDRCNCEGHVKRLWSDRPHVAEKLEQGLGADGPRQRWRACEAKVDGLEVYVMVWVIHITYEDQAEDTLFISSGLVNMSDNVFLASINLWEFKTAGFRIDSHTIKRDKCSLHCGYLVTIVSSNVVRYVSWWVAEKLKPLWKVR
jgi:hypothetical protein